MIIPGASLHEQEDVNTKLRDGGDEAATEQRNNGMVANTDSET